MVSVRLFSLKRKTNGTIQTRNDLTSVVWVQARVGEDTEKLEHYLWYENSVAVLGNTGSYYGTLKIHSRYIQWLENNCPRKITKPTLYMLTAFNITCKEEKQSKHPWTDKLTNMTQPCYDCTATGNVDATIIWTVRTESGKRWTQRPHTEGCHLWKLSRIGKQTGGLPEPRLEKWEFARGECSQILLD